MIQQPAQRGFTLIELLVVIAIISILATAGTMIFTSALPRARDGARKNDAAQIQRALQMYYNDNTDYPTTGAGVWWQVDGTGSDNLSTTLVNGQYIPKPLLDPRNAGYYHYYYNSDDGSGYLFEIRYENSNEKDFTGKHNSGDGDPSCGECPYKHVTN